MPSQLPRETLRRRIDRALRRGSLAAVAPAGYGKTVAIESALRQGCHPVADLRCRNLDRDPGRLLIRLAEAVSRAVPGAGDVLAQRLRFALEPIDPLEGAQQLAVELRELLVGRLVVFADEAEHLVGAPTAEGILGNLAELGNPTLSLAIASREPLTTTLGRLRGTGELTELGASDLSFDAEECAAAWRLRQGRAPTSRQLAELLQRSAGWPLGADLIARSGGRTGDVERFIRDEVLARLDEDERRALIEASVLDPIDSDGLRALGHSPALLARLSGLGLAASGSEDEMRLHPLARECLRKEFSAAVGKERGSEVHAAAARRAQDRDGPLDAVEHWLAAGRWSEAVDAIVASGPGAPNTTPVILREWLERLPADVRKQPTCRLLDAHLAWGTGNHERALTELNEALHGFPESDSSALVWATRSVLVDVLFSLGRLEEIEPIARELERDDALAAGLPALGTAMAVASAQAALGDDEASDALAARVLAHPQGEALVALDAVRRSFQLAPAGKLTEAIDLIDERLERIRGRDFLNRTPYLAAAKAALIMDGGDDTQAEALWRAGAEAAAQGGLAPFMVTHCRYGAAAALARLGRVEEAEVELARAGDLPFGGWRGYQLEFARGEIARRRGNVPGMLDALHRSRSVISSAPPLFRPIAVTMLAPVAVSANLLDFLAELVEETRLLVDRHYHGSRGVFLRARLLAIRSWQRRKAGDLSGADRDLAQSIEEAGETAPALLRREWHHLGEGLWQGFERGTVPIAGSGPTLAAAHCDGAELARFVGHPSAAVRVELLRPATRSGHPAALERVDALTSDPDPVVADRARKALTEVRSEPPPLSYHLLGGFSVRRGSWTMPSDTWSRPTTARLVRMLLAHGGPVAESDLFAALWPDRDESSARRNLQVTASRARAIVDLPGNASAIERTEGGYRIALGPADSLDADSFLRASEAALAAEGAPERLRTLSHARGLWLGEPLIEDRHEHWAEGLRRRLFDRWVAVLEALAEARTEQGDLHGASEAWVQLLESDPTHEGAHRELMRAYAGTGRRGHALRQFLACRRALVEELGLEPSEETIELQRRVLAGEPT
jgi:DNA-binding SARP family transcriptional activator/tetratricopeptide (TPR) repeat protein